MENLSQGDQIQSIKSRIEKLISDGYLEKAKEMLNKLSDKIPGDLDVCSMRAVVTVMEGDLEEAERNKSSSGLFALRLPDCIVNHNKFRST